MRATAGRSFRLDCFHRLSIRDGLFARQNHRVGGCDGLDNLQLGSQSFEISEHFWRFELGEG
jgi:hypothetical protein